MEVVHLTKQIHGQQYTALHENQWTAKMMRNYSNALNMALTSYICIYYSEYVLTALKLNVTFDHE